MPNTTIEIFCSYAPEDETYLRELEAHLSGLIRSGLISSIWYDRQVGPGQSRTQTIDTHLKNASLILLLISANFLESDYNYEIEMQQALQQHTAKKAQVISIIIRPCTWENASFTHLQYLPHNGKPITTWNNRDEAWNNVIASIRQIIEERITSTTKAPCVSQTPSHSHPPGTCYLTYHRQSNCLAWSPDGKFIASGGSNNTVDIWDANTGYTHYRYQDHENTVLPAVFPSEISNVIWSPDSTMIAFGGKKSPIIWNPYNNQTIAIYKHHSLLRRVISSMAWSPDGQLIASTNNGSPNDPAIHIWNPHNGQQCAKFVIGSSWTPVPPAIGGVAWSPDGKRIACGLIGEVYIYDLSTKQRLQRCESKSYWAYNYVYWSSDNTKLLFANKKCAVVWDTMQGGSLCTYIDHKAPICAIALSPDGKYVASTSTDTTVHIWKTDTGERTYLYKGHNDQVSSVAWSPDGQRVASGSKDGTIHIWQAI